ncbi:MAG TPA: PIG-L family deacetylase [Candidatus Sulfotelmatobacter sp.]|nr:PIG-L family deacetylase [Candidatus Sulfotelmatobacter sp.]
MKLHVSFVLAILMTLGLSHLQAQQAEPNPQPDPRYKVDILIVVGHPDDDTEVTSYIAKLIEEQHKKVAVVYGTRGNSGGNAMGPEQAKALADIREMEARHSLASYGINDAWFLHGSDTPGGDVLHSLEVWGHGEALEKVVRLVRITRPEVIMTWMPNYVVGENHDDHQASGVLATEAFDLAANPLAFPEQLEAPRNRFGINNYGEGLRPWQPKKVYYFSDASHFDFLKGAGPEYPTSDISPSRKIPYSAVAAEAWHFYKTQNDFNDAQLKEYSEMPVRLIFGKSLVGGTTTGDVFEGITATPIPYHRARGYEPSPAGMALELGGPWAFYQTFWPAHGIDHIGKLYAPEAQVAPGETLWVPLIIRNDTDAQAQVTLHPNLPAGWSQQPTATQYTVGPHDFYSVQLTITPSASQKGTWQTLSWDAESNGKKIGTATLRVDVASNGMPQ